MPKLKSTLVVFTSIAIISGIAAASVGSPYKPFLAKKIASEDYTLQHAALDMESIYQRLEQSTKELQEVANNFTILVERLEEKQAQHQTARGTTNN